MKVANDVRWQVVSHAFNTHSATGIELVYEKIVKKALHEGLMLKEAALALDFVTEKRY